MSSQNSDLPEDFKITELGPLPQEWETARLGELFEIKQGKALSPEHRRGISPGLFLRTANVFWGRLDLANVDNMDFTDNEVSQLRLMPNDLLVCEGGDIGRTAIWRGQLDVCCYQNHLHRLRAIRDAVYPLYYMYWMQAAHLLLGLYEGTGNKTTIPNLSQSRLKSFILPVPPLPEQKAIAGVLSTIQKAVEAQDKIIAAARELKKSLMRHLFTYGPVPVSEADKIPLKETEIGPVPEHWQVARLGDVTAKEIKNGAFVRRDSFGNGVRFLNVADTYEHISIDFRSSERVQVTQEEINTFRIEPGDLFYVRSSLKREGVGQCCIVEDISETSIYDCHLMRVRVDDKKVLPKYLAYFSVSYPGKQALISRSKTTTMTTINQQGLASFIFPLPPYPIQQQITNIIATVDRKTETSLNRKAALQALFRTMLHHLMTGKVRMKELSSS